jgi:uncharacterized protein (DUF427 family)
MARARWNGKLIAESDDIVEVEGNAYFPLASLRKEFFRDSDHTTKCGWKGTASYFHLEVEGKTNPNAAWIYRAPKEAARMVKDRVAFWKGVTVEK